MSPVMALSPLIVLSGSVTVLTLLGFLLKSYGTKWLAAAAIVLSAVFIIANWGRVPLDAEGNLVQVFGGLFRVDTLSQGLTLAALFGCLWALLLGPSEKFEYSLLILYAAAGMHVMASTTNLVVMLIALEIFSLPLYVLATWRRDERGFEAGLKYFLLGALSSAVFIYGIALYFGATGNFSAGSPGSGPLYAAAMMLLLAALGFKVSMVPFQWWTPDVYQGSPTSVALMMSTAVKAAGFAAMIRIFTPNGQSEWGLALGVVIACTVIFGNLGALVQTEAKRLLAYSSIAHAGYIGLALYSGTGGPALVFYIFVYAAATGLAFAVLQGISEGEVPNERLQGLMYRQPLLAIGLGVALLSLIGVPPFAGFWGKYLVFSEAAKAGQYGLVVLALITSAIAAYYYLRLLGLAVLSRSGENSPAPSSTLVGVVIFSLTVLLLLSLVPGLGLNTFSVGQ